MLRFQRPVKPALLIAFALFCSGSTAKSERELLAESQASVTAEKRALVEKLFASTKMDEVLNAEFTVGLKSAIENHKANEKAELLKLKVDQSIIDDELKFLDTLPDQVVKELNPARELHEILVESTAKYYDDDDLKNLSQFYEQPSGKKVIQEVPKITQDALERTRTNLLPKIESALDSALSEAEAKGLIPHMPSKPGA